METPKQTFPDEDQKLYTLGEFYVRKGEFPLAKEVFTRLIHKPYPMSHSFHLMGKVESELGNIDQAIIHLERARVMNPFFKPTLELLHRIYEKDERFQEALECMVDLYLLSKEISDTKSDKYKKKIRDLVKKISPTMNQSQKNVLIKERNKHLNEELALLEDFFSAETTLPPVPISDDLEEPEEDEDESVEFDSTTFKEYNVESLGEDPDSRLPDLIKEDSPSNVIEHSFPQSRIVVEDLTRHLLFRSLSPSHLEKIQKFSSIHHYQKNEPIHQPLDLVYGFSCVLDGKVGIYHQGIPLMQLEAGSIADEAELCMGSKYFFELKAKEASSILIIDKPALLTMCKNHHELGYHFLWHFYKSLSLKISSIFDHVIDQNPTKDVVWSLDLLQEISQQRQLTAVEMTSLERLCKKTHHMKGDFIFKNHMSANMFYILLEGDITLEHPHSNDTIQLRPNDCFSEISLVSNSFEHAMNAKVESETATLLSIDRMQLSKLYDHEDHDHYRLAEVLWKVFSWKYFEFLNFYFHLLKSSSKNE